MKRGDPAVEALIWVGVVFGIAFVVAYLTHLALIH